MTARRGRTADCTAGEDDTLLVVAVCAGQRCRALRALQDERSPGTTDSSTVISEAVRGTRRTVMLSTSCLGPCARAAVVAAGWGTLRGQALTWSSPPGCWGSTESPQQAATVGAWISAQPRR